MDEQDTYDRLRRVSYDEACFIFIAATMHLPLDATTDTLTEVAEADLRIAGWTFESLTYESEKRNPR